MSYLNEKSDHVRYEEQQNALSAIANKLGIALCKPDHHGNSMDPNTVMFYTREDAVHNSEVDKEPRFNRYFRADAEVFEKAHSTKIADKYIYRDPFWVFRNTDSNGVFNMKCANDGKFNLKKEGWEIAVEGSIRVALAVKLMNEYVIAAGGYENICEADDTYNDLNRELIRGLCMTHEKVFLGNINFHGDARREVLAGRKSVFEECTAADKVYNFSCSFVIPTPDPILASLIIAWNQDGWPKETSTIDRIMTRVVQDNGHHLVWY